MQRLGRFKTILNNHIQKSSEHIFCDYSMSVIQIFDSKENRHDVYRGEDCMEKLSESFESLREHAIKIINFEKIKIIPLAKEQQESYKKTKIDQIYKKNGI